MASENRLSMWKRKLLVEYIKKSVSNNNNNNNYYHEPEAGTNARVVPRPRRQPLNAVRSLRKKEAIVESGAYDRDIVAPPKGKGNRKKIQFKFHILKIFGLEIGEKDKDELIHRMAYGCPPSKTPDVDEVMRKRRKPRSGMEVSITPRSRQSECKYMLLDFSSIEFHRFF